MSSNLVSKVLVLDNCSTYVEIIKRFCDENDLVGLKVGKNRLFSVLDSNIDLGAILFSENYGASIEETAAIAEKIHSLRPELPIIIRRENQIGTKDLPGNLQQVLCGSYVAGNMDPLKKIIDQYIFSLQYPNALVRGVAEISTAVLANQFKDLSVTWDTPMIVRDRLIFGELFSMIPIESAWCRGYLMMQAEQYPILQLLNLNRPAGSTVGFREVNSLLGETTNLIWGAFKNRYVGDASMPSGNQVQVPLIVNHEHKYISFGTENPQLCFVYRLKDERSGFSMKIHQRFVFNLGWLPEDFEDFAGNIDSMIDAGELELF